MHMRKTRFSHIINYRQVSLALAIIIRALRSAKMSTNKMHTLRHDYINVLTRKVLNVSGLIGTSSGTIHSVELIIISNVRNCRHTKKSKKYKSVKVM